MGNTLWYNSALTDRAAWMVNQLWRKRAQSIVSKRLGTLFALMGKTPMKGIGDAAGMAVEFQRKKKITGDKIEVRLRGTAPTFVMLANGSGERASASGSNDDDAFGNATFGLGHYNKKVLLNRSSVKQIKNDEAKTTNYLAEIYEMYEEGWQQQVSGDIHDVSGAEPASDSMGSLWYAIHASNAYGTIDRSQAANAAFRGIVDSTTTTLDLPTIGGLDIQISANDGNASLGVTGVTTYGIVRELLRPYTWAENQDFLSFGAKNIKFDGVTYILDKDCPDTYVGLLTPETWGWWYSEDDPFSNFERDPGLKSAYYSFIDVDCQLICENPSRNAVLTAITS